MDGSEKRYRSLLSNVEGAIHNLWLLHGYHSRNTLVFASTRKFKRGELLAKAARLDRWLPIPSDTVRSAHHLKPYSSVVPSF
jgi:hypothetical protein